MKKRTFNKLQTFIGMSNFFVSMAQYHRFMNISRTKDPYSVKETKKSNKSETVSNE